jgi:hypothetical protein
MKRFLISASALALNVTLNATLVATFTATNASAFDWSSRSSFMTEWNQQMTRIADGRKSGRLSKDEARMLRRELETVGEMTPGTKACTMLSEHSKKIAAHKTSG